MHLDSASFDVSISGTSGGNYEDLNTADTATVTISDTIDTTTVTLGDVNVSEGDPSFTYGATVNNAVDPTGSDLVVTLSNGVEITIAAGATSGTSATQAIQGDDVHLDSASFDVSISGTSGGNYEDLNTADTATVTISDTIDTTTVTLGDVNVSEGDPSFTYGATVNNAVDPTGSDLVVTLSNGVEITIAAGATSGTSATQAIQGDDVHLDSASFDVSISGTSGGNYEDLNTADTATVTISDTIDTTTVTLGDVNVSEGDPSFTYGATVNNAVDPTGSDLVVTLSNGVEITIAAGATSGTSATQAIQGDDVHLDSASFDVSISGTSGGNYEDLNTADTATVTISDTIDTTTVTLGDVNVSEGDPSFTYGATVNNAVDPTGSDLVVTLSNGVEITIAAGATSGTSATQAIQGDDVHLDSASFDVSISGTSGGNYEDLNTADTATVTISDTIDTTTVTLSATPEVSEDGGTVTYTATVNNAPDDSDLVVTLSNGVEITIAVGETSNSEDDIMTAGDLAGFLAAGKFTVTIDDSTGGNYEAIDITDDATVDIDFDVTITNLTPKIDGGDVSVDEDDLADGSDPAPKDSLTQEGTFTISAPDGVASLTIGGTDAEHTFITNDVFTAGSFTTALGNTLSITGFDGSVITYTYELLDNEDHAIGAGENDLFEDLDVVLTDSDTDSTSGTLSVRIVDDVPTINSIMDAVMASQSGITVAGMYDADFGADGLDLLSVALNAGGQFSGAAVVFDQTADTPTSGVTQVDVDDAGTGLNLFIFFYTVTPDPVSASGDGSVELVAFTDPDNPGGSPFFTLTVEADGTYDFTLHDTSIITRKEVDTTLVQTGGNTASLDLGGLVVTADAPPQDTVNFTTHGLGAGNATWGQGETFTLD